MNILINIYLIDHDCDSERNIVWLKPNEVIIRFKGIEKLRLEYEDIISDITVADIIEKLKNAILDDIMQLSKTC